MIPSPTRGDVWYVSLDPVMGSEQAKTRPCLVVQRDSANSAARTTIVCPLTSAGGRRANVLNVPIAPPEAGVKKHSVVLINQVRVIDKARLRGSVMGRASEATMARVDEGLRVIFNLDD